MPNHLGHEHTSATRIQRFFTSHIWRTGVSTTVSVTDDWDAEERQLMPNVIDGFGCELGREPEWHTNMSQQFEQTDSSAKQANGQQ